MRARFTILAVLLALAACSEGPRQLASNAPPDIYPVRPGNIGVPDSAGGQMDSQQFHDLFGLH